MSAVTSAAPLRAERTSSSVLATVLVAGATALAILGAALALLLTPLYTHWALDTAGSARFLGADAATTHHLSDRTIGELLVGPGTFGYVDGCPRAAPRSDIYSCFYDASEASHLRDARTVLYAFGALALVSVVGLAVAFARTSDRSLLWRGVSRGAVTLAVAFAVVGVFFVVAFDTAFTLFHQVFFPGGNWAFDPTSQRLVQLYPIPFWQLTSGALGALAIGGGMFVWWLARRRARRLEREARP